MATLDEYGAALKNLLENLPGGVDDITLSTGSYKNGNRICKLTTTIETSTTTRHIVAYQVDDYIESLKATLGNMRASHVSRLEWIREGLGDNEDGSQEGGSVSV